MLERADSLAQFKGVASFHVKNLQLEKDTDTESVFKLDESKTHEWRRKWSGYNRKKQK